MDKKFFQIPLPLTFDFLRKSARVNPLIINYHFVSEKEVPYVSHLYGYRNQKMFAEDLDFLLHNFHFVGLPELLNSIKNSVRLPQNAFMITFDDGFKEILENAAPVLISKKIFPTIFLTKNYIDNFELGYDHKKSLLVDKLVAFKDQEKIRNLKNLLISNSLYTGNLDQSIIKIPYKKRLLVDQLGQVLDIGFDGYLKTHKPYLTSAQILDLKNQGFTFGGHSIDHPNFAELTLEEQVHQASESVEFVCRQYSLNYRAFAFPYWDAAVSKSFFDSLYKTVDVSFGTQGLLEDTIKNNYQRISVEGYNYCARKIIKTHYFRKMLYKMLKKDIILRN